jgi:hypothetical protein
MPYGDQWWRTSGVGLKLNLNRSELHTEGDIKFEFEQNRNLDAIDANDVNDADESFAIHAEKFYWSE